MIGVRADGCKELATVVAALPKSAHPGATKALAESAPHLVALARAGARFERGVPVECPKAAAA